MTRYTPPVHSSVGFLLGSGVSCANGAPGVAALTTAVLEGNYCRYSDGTIGRPRPGQVIDRADPVGPSCRNALRGLRDHVAPYYERVMRRTPNYEDLLYVIGQLADEWGGDLDNPLVEFGSGSVTRILSGGPNPGDKSYFELQNYVRGVVCAELENVPRTSALAFVSEAIASRPDTRIPILTLNHDLAIEKHVSGIADGFTERERGLFSWDPASLAKVSGRPFLLKLHGSIDWWRHPGEVNRIIRFGPTSENHYDLRRRVSQPVILAGTFNKLFGYTSGIFADLFELLRRELRSLDALIVCGYGFGDKGINNQLIAWMDDKDSRRMVMVHPKPSDLVENARPAVQRAIERWKKTTRLGLLEAGAEAVHWVDVAPMLDS